MIKSVISNIGIMMFPLEIEFNSGSRAFLNVEEFRAFLEDQLLAYSWIKPHRIEHGSDIAGHIINTLNNMLNMSHSFNDNYAYSQQLEDQARAFFGRTGLPVFGTPAYDYIEDLRKNQSDKAAIGALSFFVGRITNALFDGEVFAGLVAVSLRDLGVTRQSAAAARKSFDRLSGQMNSAQEKVNKDLIKHDRLAEEERNRSRHRSSIQRRWDSRKLDRQLRSNAKRHDAALSEFNNMRKTYEELMALKAPVDYWRDKAKHHRAESIRYRTALVEWSKVLIPSVMFVLLCLSGISFLFVQADKPAASYLILITLGVVATTIAFWAARILVRLYMSEHHLSIDADERATMVMTYLALTERGAAEEKDRALILAPLFRPSSDGIVKDDAAPDLSPASLLSKITSR